MAKYSELAEDILKHVGGKQNVNSLKHCVTRLRFDLKDESKADDDYLKNRDGVVTVVKAGGQYQVVIGNHVPDVYAEVLQVGGLPAGGSLDIDEGDAPKGNLFDRFVSLVSSIFQPFLGPLAAAGIIKGIVAIMAACGLSAATSPMYVIFNAAGDGFFQFLPILIALTSARRFKVNEFTAIAIAAALVYPDIAPKASENFLKHAKDKYYDGLTFHRVIKDFMVQSGDPKGDGTGGESIWKKGFAVEPTPFLYNIRGALAMANTGAKNSNGSQFYIVQNKDDQSKQLGNAGYPKPIIDAYKKGGYPAGDTKYTVFGQVIKGMDVVDTIANLEVDDNSKPKENVTVNSVEVVKDYKFK